MLAEPLVNLQSLSDTHRPSVVGWLIDHSTSLAEMWFKSVEPICLWTCRRSSSALLTYDPAEGTRGGRRVDARGGVRDERSICSEGRMCHIVSGEEHVTQHINCFRS